MVIYFISMVYFLSLSCSLLSSHLLHFLTFTIFTIASYKLYYSSYYFLYSLILFILFSLYISYLLLFYCFFELFLIPIFLIILYSGQSSDMAYVSYKFLYFSIGISFLWFGSLVLSFKFYVFLFPILWLVFILFLLPILLKLPLPPFHIWLNDTHTASPLASSIILAGSVIKVSPYAYFTFFIPNFFPLSKISFEFLYPWVVFSSCYTSALCIRQNDYKRLIAYSSVSHMNVLFYSFLPCYFTSYYGSFLMLIAHGFTSPALFYQSNSIYERFGTKYIPSLRGLSSSVPVAAVFALLFHLSNFSFPPFISWFAEFWIFTDSLVWFPFSTVFISTTMIFALVYSVFLFFRIYFGFPLFSAFFSYDFSFISFFLNLLLFLLSFYFILFYWSIC